MDSVASHRSPGSWETSVAALGAGVALGAVTAFAAFSLARYGPSGGDWSFRGNGALAAYSLIPAFLAGGWTAVVLHHRRRPWIGLGPAAAAVGIALALVDAALLPAFGPTADQTVGPIVLIALIAWTFVAPALAMRFPGGRSATTASITSSAAAAFLFAAGLVGGLVLVGLVIPAGS